MVPASGFSLWPGVLEIFEEGKCPLLPALPTPPPQAVIRRVLEVEELGSFVPSTDMEIPTVCKVQETQRQDLRFRFRIQGSWVVGVGSGGE